MGLVLSLCSAKGSPGVTTTALALAHAWPRPVLVVEADVSAGSAILAGHLGGREPHERGLLGLALAHRRRGRLTADDLWQQVLELSPGRFLLPGLWDPVQAAQLAATWTELAGALLDLPDVDVLIDHGRLGTASAADPLLYRSDLVVALTRCTLVDAYALTRRMPALAAALQPELLRLGTVGPRDPYTPHELGRKLDLPVLFELPWDPGTAGLYSHGRPPGRRRGPGLDVAAAEAARRILTTAGRTSTVDGVPA